MSIEQLGGPQMRLQRFTALVATLAVAVAACGSDDDGGPAADSPSPTTPTTGPTAEPSQAPTTTGSEPSTAPTSTATEASPATPQPVEPPASADDVAVADVDLGDAEPLTEAFAEIGSGPYRFDITGTPVGLRFDGDEPWFVQANFQGSFVVSHAASQGPNDRDVVFMRTGTLPDPDNLTAPLSSETAERWPADDIDGWLEAVPAGLSISDLESTTVGGFDATRFDVSVEESDCEPGTTACVVFAPVNGVNAKHLVPGSTYRIWMIAQPGEDPLAVVAGINRSSDTEWLDTVERVMSTAAFGEVAPNPILTAPGGQVELPFLGGVRIDVDAGTLINRGPKSQIGFPDDDYPAGTEFLTNPLDATDAEIPDADALVEALTAGGLEVNETDATSIAGFDARVFDFGGVGGGEVLGIDGSAFGWFPPERGRIWAIDHPDRGLLVVTAEASSNPDAGLEVDTVFPLILARTEASLESLEFV